MTRAYRSRRLRGVPRAVTLRQKELNRRELNELRASREMTDAELDAERPKTRGDCRDGLRPCPFVACKHHLYLDVNPETGSVKLNYPHLEPWDMAESCALDVAERGGLTLEDAGLIMNVTRERARQLEVRGLINLMRSPAIKECK